jgi:CRISPR-associated protein Cst2
LNSFYTLPSTQKENMALHIFANVVTSFGTAANNRAENEGNITTLQKLIWKGQTHSTVSAEAIRFAIRRQLAEAEKTNRSWDENLRANVWEDHKFSGWADAKKSVYVDDDLLGFMTAEASNEEGTAGSANVRRAVLEVTRAVSLTPWSGDVTFNAASPGATPSAAKKGTNPVPYGTEVHATRYQFGAAMTPARLRDPSRAKLAVEGICSLRTVAGNHGRFLYDFAPDVVVFRVTTDPAPRCLYCFNTIDSGETVHADALIQRIDSGDIDPGELHIGVSNLESSLAKLLKSKGISVLGVKAAAKSVTSAIDKSLKAKI